MIEEFKKFIRLLDGVNIIKEENNILSFEYKNLSYLFVSDENDPYYVRLILPNIATATNLKNGVEITKVVNELNIHFKVAKSIIKDDSIWISAEQFVYSRDRASDLFQRILTILEVVIESFRRDYLRNQN